MTAASALHRRWSTPVADGKGVDLTAAKRPFPGQLHELTQRHRLVRGAITPGKTPGLRARQRLGPSTSLCRNELWMSMMSVAFTGTCSASGVTQAKLPAAFTSPLPR